MKCEKVNRTFGPAGQNFCRSGQDLTGPKMYFFLNLKNYRVSQKNAPVIFPFTTGTNTLGTWKTKTDMESLLSQLFIVYSVFILPLPNR